MKYEKAIARVIRFSNSDVLTSSYVDPDDPYGFCKYQGNSHHKNCYEEFKWGFQNGSAKDDPVDESFADYWNKW